MSDADRIRWARAVGVAGWMFAFAYLGEIIGIVRRATRVDTASFEDGLWWQRVEIVSFVSLPQNFVVLVPAAIAASVGAVLARTVVDQSVLWIRQLARVTAGVCYVVIFIALLGIVGLFFRNPDDVGDVSALLGRVGGIMMAYGMIRLCLEAERTS